MAINTSKVVVGGLAAGVVANIIGFLGFGALLGPRFEAEPECFTRNEKSSRRPESRRNSRNGARKR
jgi:hypothetical protein